MKPDPSCLDPVEPDFISVDAAREAIFAALMALRGHEQSPLAAALGRVLAQDVHAPIDVPRQDNSAMDGFAVATGGKGAPAGASFRLLGAALAGRPFPGRVGAGDCIRITTGAWIPEGADSVVIQERAQERDSQIVSLDAVEPGQNLRRAGEDVRAGEVLLAAGTRLWPAHLGLLGSVGMAEVALTRTPRVAYFSTGDEVRSLGDTLEEGAIYDSNRHSVRGMLARLGIDMIDLGVVADTETAMRDALAAACRQADAVITSGGVSVGSADFIKPVLRGMGEARFWKVAVRPGRPFTFGMLDHVAFFGLPGNPVATMIMFYQLIQPALRRLSGERDCLPLELDAECRSHLRKRPGRVEYQRGVLARAPDGTLQVEKTGMQGSGILSSMARANCLIVLDEACAGVSPGERVRVQPFHGLV